jgi:hypothetical protein
MAQLLIKKYENHSKFIDINAMTFQDFLILTFKKQFSPFHGHENLVPNFHFLA